MAQMKREKLKELIMEYMTTNNGTRQIALLMILLGRVGVSAFTTDQFNLALDELLRDKEIFRLKFTEPEFRTPERSVLFTKGTQFLNLKEFVEEIAVAETHSTSQTQLVNKSSPNL